MKELFCLLFLDVSRNLNFDLRVISEIGTVLGVAVLGSELFVVRAGCNAIGIHDLRDFTLHRVLKVPGMSYPRSLVGCERYNCLYVGDAVQKSIYRVDLITGQVIQWSVYPGWPRGLSITKNHNLLVTLSISNKLQEFETNGTLIREIHIDFSIDNPRHAVELLDDQFLVCHAGRAQHRICILNADGRIVHSYGGSPGSSTGQLSDPQSVVVDSEGNVIVADCGNERVAALNGTLAHIGYLSVEERKLKGPYALHFYEPSACLMVIGELRGKHLRLGSEL